MLGMYDTETIISMFERRAEYCLSLKFRGPAISLVLSIVPKMHLHAWGTLDSVSRSFTKQPPPCPHYPQTRLLSLRMALEGQQEKVSPDPKTAPSLDTPSKSRAKLSCAFSVSLLWHPFRCGRFHGFLWTDMSRVQCPVLQVTTLRASLSENKQNRLLWKVQWPHFGQSAEHLGCTSWHSGAKQGQS